MSKKRHTAMNEVYKELGRLVHRIKYRDKKDAIHGPIKKLIPQSNKNLV